MISWNFDHPDVYFFIEVLPFYCYIIITIKNPIVPYNNNLLSHVLVRVDSAHLGSFYSRSTMQMKEDVGRSYSHFKVWLSWKSKISPFHDWQLMLAFGEAFIWGWWLEHQYVVFPRGQGFFQHGSCVLTGSTLNMRFQGKWSCQPLTAWTRELAQHHFCSIWLFIQSSRTDLPESRQGRGVQTTPLGWVEHRRICGYL